MHTTACANIPARLYIVSVPRVAKLHFFLASSFVCDSERSISCIDKLIVSWFTSDIRHCTEAGWFSFWSIVGIYRTT